MADTEGKRTEDELIVDEAKRRFKRCSDHESVARQRQVEDQKFVEGDSRNMYQWEDAQVQARQTAQKPALTINKTREHCLQIINDQRQNKSQIRITPVGDGATFEAAQVLEGIVRHIEYQSNAMESYDRAAWHQVTGGYGMLRVRTDYIDDMSMDQEIYIDGLKDPLCGYLDPDAQQFDRSDARFGFVFNDMPRDEFESEYPELKDNMPSGNTIDGVDDRDWHNKDHVRVCEYFRQKQKSDTLHHVEVPDHVMDWPLGAPRSGIVKQSDFPKDSHKRLTAMASRSRPITTAEIEWFKIVGNDIVDRNIWPGRYVPLIPVIGEETVIDGELDRKGHVRALLDPQRSYNWMASEAVTYVAGQTKTPYIADARAIEGYETYWDNANVTTQAYLPYNSVDANGQKIEKPERIPAPLSHAAANEGMNIAQQQMMMASGQYQSQFGENENAKSGVAINARQRQGDNATYHYTDHLAQAIRFLGRQLIDLIPKVYDTPRVIKIMAEDGDQTEVQVDPTAPQPHQQVGPNGQPLPPQQVAQAQQDPTLADKVKTIFNPTLGRYDVESDVGPSFATRRQEGFNAITQILTQNKELTNVIGDLLFKNADFPGADEIAKRLKRMAPPQALGIGPPPQVQQMQQHFQQQIGAAQKIIAHLTDQLADKGAKDREANGKADLDNYRAETDRMKAIGAIDPQAMVPVIRQLISEALGTPIVPLMGAHAVAEQTFIPGDPAAGGMGTPGPGQTVSDPASGMAGTASQGSPPGIPPAQMMQAPPLPAQL